MATNSENRSTQDSADQASEVPSVSQQSADLRTAISKDAAQASSPVGAPPLTLDFLTPAQQPDELGRLAEYRVLKELGHGGMGAVFLADDTKLKRKVALKLMLPQVARVEVNRERFLREAQAAAQLEHDNVVTVHQVGEANGVPFIAMPFLKGESLQTRLQREGALPVSEVIRIGQQIAEGLAAAHEQDLVHRDIKPGNIWLEDRSAVAHAARVRPSPEIEPDNDEDTRTRAACATNTRVKILDFGLARLATSSEAQHLTTSGTILGTPSYMAPEQARGSHDVDFRCDLFSLGAVLYRMATGRQPFSGDTTYALLTALAVDTPAVPRELNPDIPHELSDLIMQLLAKQPEARPANAREVVQRLQRSRLAPRDDRRTSHDADRALRHQTADDATRALGDPVAERQGYDPATTVILPATEQRQRRKRLLIGLAFAAVVVLAGIIIRIKHKDGTVTEIKVSGNPTVEVIDDKSTAADPDRAAAEWVLGQKAARNARVEIQLIGPPATVTVVHRNEKLPDEPFRVLGMHVVLVDITDNDLANHLPRLKHLSVLELPGCTGITDASLPLLCDVKTLKHLNVGGTRLSPTSCVKLMQSLPLKLIMLSPSHFTPEVIDCISATPSIQYIGINGYVPNSGTANVAATASTIDKQLKSLFQIKHLSNLIVHDATADLATWRELPESLPNLASLSIQHKSIGDDHLREFSRLINLNRFNFTGTSITSAGLPALYGLSQLRQIELVKTTVTAEAVRTLHDHLPLCRITWDGGVIEPRTADPERADIDPQRRAAEAILEAGGTIIVIVGPTVSHIVTVAKPEDLPEKPFVLSRVDLTNRREWTDEQLQLLRDIPWLPFLYMTGTSITDEGLESISDLVGWGLVFNSTNVTDAGIHRLGKRSAWAALNIEETGVTDAACETLSAMPRLEQLNFGNTPITDLGIRQFGKAKSLRSLFPDRKMTVEGLNALTDLPRLQVLRLGYISESNLKPMWTTLEQMKSLRLVTLEKGIQDGPMRLQSARPELVVAHPAIPLPETEIAAMKWILGHNGRLSGTKSATFATGVITFDDLLVRPLFADRMELKDRTAPDVGIENVQGLRYLETLLWPSLRLDDETTARMASMVTLRSIQGDNRNLTATGLARLATLPNLDALALYEASALKDDDFAPLSLSTSLHRLLLSRSTVRDGALIHVGRCPNLDHLELEHCRELTHAGLTHLEPLQWLWTLDLFGNTQLDDRAVEPLSRLKSLRLLFLSGTSLTPDAITRLSRALPRCAIFWNGPTIIPGPK